MSDLSGLRTAQVLGITSAAFLAGKGFAQSFTTTPALLLAPAPLLAKQWKRMNETDRAVDGILVVGSGALITWLASREARYSRPFTLYTTSSLLLLTSALSRFLLTEPLRKKLYAKATQYSSANVSSYDLDIEKNVPKEQTVHYLVDLWATVNLGRAVLAGVSAVLAMWAALEKRPIGAGIRFTSGANRMGR